MIVLLFFLFLLTIPEFELPVIQVQYNSIYNLGLY